MLRQKLAQVMEKHGRAQMVSLSLSPELQAVAERLRVTGRYGNISDGMRAALRLLEVHEPDCQQHRDTRLLAAESAKRG